MKPIKLRIKGLNSFVEEQIVDFEKLTDRGLFGIFGPTGSGKSTILDGITLALYGDVARKSSNYINTNCDRLNVSFEFQISGAETKRYIAEREFKRNKEGNAISGKCKIIDITNVEEQQVLADKVGTVNDTVKEIIGLNLDDFTRTVVLPQGKFSEFLKLEGKERREMLERLFNLQKYGENLSKKLNGQISKERTNNNILIGQLSGYDDVTVEKLNEKKEELRNSKETLERLKESLEDIEKQYKESDELWKLSLEFDEYKNREEILKEKEEEITQFLEKIKLGEAGEKVIPYINAYENTVNEFKNNKEELKALNLRISKIIEEKENIEKTWIKAKEDKENKLPKLILHEQKVQDAIEEEKLLYKIQNDINLLNIEIQKLEHRNKEIQIKLKNIDESIVYKNNEIKEDEKIYEKLRLDESFKEKVQQGMIEEEKYNNLSSIINKNKEKKNSIVKENDKNIIDGKKLKAKLEEKSEMLKAESEKLKSLIESCPGEQKDLLQLQEVLVISRDKWRNYNKLNKEITLAHVEMKDLENRILAKKQELIITNEQLKKLKDEQKIVLRENLAQKLREELNEGEECPVCGSVHHFKENIKPIEVSSLKLIEDEINNKESFINNINHDIAKYENNFDNFNNKIILNKEEINKIGSEFKENSTEELESRFEKLKNSLEIYKKEKEDLERKINKINNEIIAETGEINALRKVVMASTNQISEIEKDIDDDLKELDLIQNKLVQLKDEINVDNFKKKNDEIKESEKRRESIANTIKCNRKKLEELDKMRVDFNNELTAIKEQLAKNNANLYGFEKNKEEKINLIKTKVGEEKNLNELLADLQKEIKYINEIFDDCENNKTKIEKEFVSCNETLIKTNSKCDELNKRVNENHAQLEIAIDSEGFKTLEEVKNNIIDKVELDRYKEKVELYKDSLSKIKGALESLSKKINGRKITKEDYERIIAVRFEKNEEYKNQNEIKIKLEEEVKGIKAKVEELKELLDKKKSLDHKLALLNDLEKLFKGKKFVEFVASHQLKYVSLEASKRLKEITHGNYGLEVDENGKFIIRDYKNGGAARDASTLSGGETFLASLSLALSLSAQIQLKGTAPLELFFLDEGFGTLDDELLDVVMSSLEKIHNDKLKVGIISHVESIKNRIPVKLLITPAECGIGGSRVKIERS